MNRQANTETQTLEQLLGVTGEHPERVRQRAVALLNLARLRLDRPAMKVTAARSDLPGLLSEVRDRRPRVISSANRQSVVMLTVDDLLALVALTDPQAKLSSLGRLAPDRRPGTRINSRDAVVESPDERPMRPHAHYRSGRRRNDSKATAAVPA